MKVIAIAAVGKNGVIGSDLDLPWNIPEDMKFFRDSTREQIVVMGRKTYLSMKKALPKRENAVISRDTALKLPDARVFHSIEEAVAFYKRREGLSSKNIFIIGGAEIYKLAISHVDELWLTEIDAEFPGNIHFPYYENGVFQRPEFSSSELKIQEDFENSPFKYKFRRYAKP